MSHARCLSRVLCLSCLLILPTAGPVTAAVRATSAVPATEVAGAAAVTHATSSSAPGWSLAPAGGGRPAFYAEGTPGTVLQDTVSVTNRGAGPVTVGLRGTGLPVVLARTEVRVPARTRADVPFTITVPDTGAPGDLAGTIGARDGDGHRATVRIRLRAAGPALAALTVEHVAVHGDRITYELVNRGTTVLAPHLAVHAEGVLGTVLDRAPRALPVRLEPGRRLRLSEPWPGRPTLDAVEVRLTVTAPGGAHDTAGTSARFVPWGPLAAGTGGSAALAGGALFTVRRRGRRGPDGADVGEPPCASHGLTGAVR
ncbi:hypothetical protein ACF1B0_24660 [Streptomyces anandii]|uniref:COG1470 family protein n=1 Tax=Streptomyces anandii TaxID=285454 RepID=UPI003700AB9B